MTPLLQQGCEKQGIPNLFRKQMSTTKHNELIAVTEIQKV